MLTRKDGTVRETGGARLAAVVSAACIIAGKPPTPSDDRRGALKSISRWPPFSLADRLLCCENRHLMKRSIFFRSLSVMRRQVKSTLRSSSIEGTTPPIFEGTSGTEHPSTSDPGSTGNERSHTTSTPQPRGETTPFSYDNTLGGIHLQTFSGLPFFREQLFKREIRGLHARLGGLRFSRFAWFPVTGDRPRLRRPYRSDCFNDRSFPRSVPNSSKLRAATRRQRSRSVAHRRNGTA
jgi:hypothetical protein